ncbi:MAG TPA: hypothetical protein VGH97_14095 [Thermoanaerobaculia bacterium]
MIVFENAPQPAVRAGEAEIGGRRVAGRLLPYGADPDAGMLRFDPLTRRFPRRREETVVMVGPANAEAWREAALRLPSGPVLVGPGGDGSVEEIRGAYRAAAEGALAAGRAVYLLDPPADGIPRQSAATGKAGMVALCAYAARSTTAFPALAAARTRGLVCGVLFPLVPGWTAEPAAIEAILGEAAAAGARAATPLVPEADGEGRRAIVEARTFPVDGDGDAADMDAFFALIHHREWVGGMVERLPAVRSRCAAHGLGLLPPRPTGPLEPAGNAAASARLEERAELDALPEHRAAVLRAAVRWIDESGRDLAAVAREGNFRRVFPFDDVVASEAEAALRPSE